MSSERGRGVRGLWRGADNVPELVRALGDEEGVVTGVSISAYLGSSRVVVADDPVVEAAFPGFAEKFEKHLRQQAEEDGS